MATTEAQITYLAQQMHAMQTDVAEVQHASAGITSKIHVTHGLSGHQRTLVIVILFFQCKPYVTKYSRHQPRTSQNCKEFFLSWIVSDKGGQKDDDNKESLSEILFRHNAQQQNSMWCKLIGWP